MKKYTDGVMYIYGDILSPYKGGDGYVVVCNQVNCQGDMVSGLSLRIKREFPGVFDVYKEKCDAANDKHDLLGDIQGASCLDEAGFVILNLFGQETFGQGVSEGKCYTDYAAIEGGFKQIAAAFRRVTIRIPYLMGCTSDGGCWQTVMQLITDCLVAKGVPVEIWESI